MNIFFIRHNFSFNNHFQIVLNRNFIISLLIKDYNFFTFKFKLEIKKLKILN